MDEKHFKDKAVGQVQFFFESNFLNLIFSKLNNHVVQLPILKLYSIHNIDEMFDGKYPDYFILDSFLEKYPINIKFGQFMKINLKTSPDNIG